MRQERNYLLACLGVFAAYVVSGKLGLQLAPASASATAVWAPAGVALAALILFGPRVWLGVFAGAFAVNVALTGDSYSSLIIAAGSTLEAAAAAFLVVRFASGRRALMRVGSILRFSAVALGAPLVGASTGVLTLVLTGHAPWPSALPLWTTWWIGDAAGGLVVAPLLLAWASGVPSMRAPRELPGAVLRYGPRGGTAVVACVSILTVHGVAGVGHGRLPDVDLALLAAASAAAVGGVIAVSRLTAPYQSLRIAASATASAESTVRKAPTDANAAAMPTAPASAPRAGAATPPMAARR
ncbi:MAG: MASE1 domain-containing protein [Chloroflexi bacterium]|nr:MASE1 domain-containing protein [Chloroflexota bacterium]